VASCPELCVSVRMCAMCVGVCLYRAGVCQCVVSYLYYHISNGNLEIYFIKSKCVYLGIGPPNHSGTSA
jgi:hypothetical protein